ncbi:MAG: multicopper oxidase domain-containing protein [Acidimicrobiales bacterium]
MSESTKGYASQAAFASDQPKQDNPQTQFRKTPAKAFQLDFFSRRLRFPDGAEHDMWCFESPTSGRVFPAPLLRFNEGDIAHVTLNPSKGAHTIHLHGQEPDPRNDGVGHTSFEVTGSYTYQWRPAPGSPGNPNQGSAGTFFYHCHVNTVLHVQMGMFGPLIVDPVTHPAFPVTAGTRRSFVDGPQYDIATEHLLMPYMVDPRWHQLSHNAGLAGEDVGLNRFDPKHFYVLGGNLSAKAPTSGVSSLREIRANVIGGSKAPSLLRVVNSSNFPTRLRFTAADGVTPAPIAEIIAHDGRALRATDNPGGPALPLRDRGRPLLTDRLVFGAAERFDLLLVPHRAAQYRVHVEFLDWISQRLRGAVTVPITAG